MAGFADGYEAQIDSTHADPIRTGSLYGMCHLYKRLFEPDEWFTYEIAFSEYAMGLGYELSQQDPNMPPDDLLYEVRSTLNRISTAAVALYR